MKIVPGSSKVPCVTKGQLKNYRARQVTLDHLSGSQQKHGLPSEAATIKVALCLLHTRARGTSVWKVYQEILRQEEEEKRAGS